MTDTDLLKQNGFIVIQVEPLKWHIRGFEGKMDLWPVLKKCRLPYNYEKPAPYTDILAVVKNCSYMVAFELPTPEQEAAYLEWKDRLECVMITIHRAMTCAKKELAVKLKKVKKVR